MNDLYSALAEYMRSKRIYRKGQLAVMLHVTRQAKTRVLPLDPSNFITPGTGQVAGLSRSSVQAVLKDYGISHILAEEGGRTSRGSLGLMRDYVAFLNTLNDNIIIDIAAIEAWWVDRAKEHFKSIPFSLKFDQAKSLSYAVHELLEQARMRQRANPGTTYSGTVLQHLVGAKLETILPDGQITHHGASVADAATARSGDFIIGETIIHVTTAPAEALMRKCLNNIDSGFRPIIITTHESKAGAASLLNIHGIGDRVDLLDAEQFLATNVYEWSHFKISDCRPTVERLLTRYNAIVEQCETDPSLKVCLG